MADCDTPMSGVAALVFQDEKEDLRASDHITALQCVPHANTLNWHN